MFLVIYPIWWFDKWSGWRDLNSTYTPNSEDFGKGVTVDSSDNIYVTGYTVGGLDGNFSSGDVDIILVKYNSDGVLY